MNPLSVAVITSTIGRAELARAIQSVQAQTYPCKHYVFVDGKAFKAPAEALLTDYPDVEVTYLPMNTGGGGWTNSSINAIAPFLVKEEVVCFLDDDNWFSPDHIEKNLEVLQSRQLDYVYSLRKLFDSKEGHFICYDLFEAIGKLQTERNYQLPVNFPDINFSGVLTLNREIHVDTNCFMFKKAVAQQAAPYWVKTKANDNVVSHWLFNESGFHGDCSGIFSVNYSAEIKKYFAPVYNLLCQHGLSEEKSENLSRQLLIALNERAREKLIDKVNF